MKPFDPILHNAIQQTAEALNYYASWWAKADGDTLVTSAPRHVVVRELRRYGIRSYGWTERAGFATRYCEVRR